MPLVRYRKVVILGYRSVGELRPAGRERGRAGAVTPEEGGCSEVWKSRGKRPMVCRGLQEAERVRVNVHLAAGTSGWSPLLLGE